MPPLDSPDCSRATTRMPKPPDTSVPVLSAATPTNFWSSLRS